MNLVRVFTWGTLRMMLRYKLTSSSTSYYLDFSLISSALFLSTWLTNFLFFVGDPG